MNVSVVARPEMKAIVLKTMQSGRDVRAAWKEGQRMLQERNAAWINRDIGYVFVPEWQWSTSVEDLWVGVEVEDFMPEHEGFERFTLPARTYATIQVKGDRKHMENAYNDLSKWFDENGYKRDYRQGSFSFEANSLKPVNPFDIPADQINYFDFQIYAPII